jgi:hypothetical protein
MINNLVWSLIEFNLIENVLPTLTLKSYGVYEKHFL